MTRLSMLMTKCIACGDEYTGLRVSDGSGNELKPSAIDANTWQIWIRGNNNDSRMNMSKTIHTDWS
jgi:hypothetical protein